MSQAVQEFTAEKGGQTSSDRPYPPSWFDRLEVLVDRLPGPYILYYAGFGLVIGLYSVLTSNVEQGAPTPFSPTTRIFGAYLITHILSFGHYLDRAAAGAVEKLKPSLDLDEAAFAELKYRLTNLPAGMTALVSTGWLFILLAALLFYPDFVGIEMDLRDPGMLSFLVQGAIVWWLLGLGSYHTVHQLREVSRTHEQYLHVNLYNLGDLYALSSMSAISSIGVIAPITIAVVAIPEYMVQPMGLAFIVLCSVIAAATLAWPIWNVHQAMVKEKERIQAACAARYESLLHEWHEKIDRRELEGIADLYAAIEGLAAEKDEIKKTPTWPWSPGILRGWVASLFLPLAVWTLQLLLENVVFGG